MGFSWMKIGVFAGMLAIGSATLVSAAPAAGAPSGPRTLAELNPSKHVVKSAASHKMRKFHTHRKHLSKLSKLHKHSKVSAPSHRHHPIA